MVPSTLDQRCSPSPRHRLLQFSGLGMGLVWQRNLKSQGRHKETGIHRRITFLPDTFFKTAWAFLTSDRVTKFIQMENTVEARREGEGTWQATPRNRNPQFPWLTISMGPRTVRACRGFLDIGQPAVTGLLSYLLLQFIVIVENSRSGPSALFILILPRHNFKAPDSLASSSLQLKRTRLPAFSPLAFMGLGEHLEWLSCAESAVDGTP